MSRLWRQGDKVIVPVSGATGTIIHVRKKYIIVMWDDWARERLPMLPEVTKLDHDNTLRLLYV